MNGSGDSCFPSHDRVAFEARLSEGAVRRAIQHLRQYGWLEKLSGSAPGHAAAYAGRIPDVPDEHRSIYVPPERRAHKSGVITEQRADERGERRTRERGVAEQRAVQSATPRPGARPGSQEEEIEAAATRAREKPGGAARPGGRDANSAETPSSRRRGWERKAYLVAGHRQLVEDGRKGNDGLAFTIGRDDLGEQIEALAAEHPNWSGEQLGNAVPITSRAAEQAPPTGGVKSYAPRLPPEAFEGAAGAGAVPGSTEGQP